MNYNDIKFGELLENLNEVIKAEICKIPISEADNTLKLIIDTFLKSNKYPLSIEVDCVDHLIKLYTEDGEILISNIRLYRDYEPVGDFYFIHNIETKVTGYNYMLSALIKHRKNGYSELSDKLMKKAYSKDFSTVREMIDAVSAAKELVEELGSVVEIFEDDLSEEEANNLYELDWIEDELKEE